MASLSEVETREAEHGQKMIEIKLRFWTNGLSGEKGRVAPKHAWTAGVVRIVPNAAHEIERAKPVPFNSLMEITAAVEKVLVQQGITLHAGKMMKKYIENDQ